LLRKLSVALAAAVTAAVGLMGLAAPATAATNTDLHVKLKSVCQPDEHHAKLAVVNKSEYHVKYLLKKKDGRDGGMNASDLSASHREWIWGHVGPGQTAFEKVPFKSPEDTWALYAWQISPAQVNGVVSSLTGILGGVDSTSHFKPVDWHRVGDLKPCFELAAICKPDPEHVKLQVTNNTWKDAKYLLVRKNDHHKKVWGFVAAGESDIAKVPFKSPEDTWLLFTKKHEEENDVVSGSNQVLHEGKDKFHFRTKLTVGDVKLCWDLAAVCKENSTVRLTVTNNSPWDVKYLLVRKENHEKIKGEVAAGETATESVPFNSAEDTWLLFVKKEHEDDSDGGDAQVMWDGKHKFKFADKVVVGNLPACETPTEKPTTTEPALPVTGTSSVGIMGAGLGMLGIGALLLFVARRRRAME